MLDARWNNGEGKDVGEIVFSSFLTPLEIISLLMILVSLCVKVLLAA